MEEIKGSWQTRAEVAWVKTKVSSHPLVTVHLALHGLCDLMYEEPFSKMLLQTIKRTVSLDS